jgi:hypothetical protein
MIRIDTTDNRSAVREAEVCSDNNPPRGSAVHDAPVHVRENGADRMQEFHGGAEHAHSGHLRVVPGAVLYHSVSQFHGDELQVRNDLHESSFLQLLADAGGDWSHDPPST